MNKFVQGTTIWLLIFAFNASFAVESSSIILSEEPSEVNTSLNIKGSVLIEKYLIKYIDELNDFKDNYRLENDVIIDDVIKNCQSMVFSLRKIQTDRVEKEVAEKTMSEIIARIKSLNKNVKIYLKNKSQQVKEDTVLLQWKYESSIIIFSNKLNLFIIGMKRKILKDWIINENEKNIIEYLSLLEKEYTKLRNIKNTPFKNPLDLKDEIKSIITTIKNHMKEIKELLN